MGDNNYGLDNGAMSAASAGMSALNGAYTFINNAFGGSEHKARKMARYQQQLNQQMALWNMDNVTRPIYDLEQQQWETRFNMENAYNTPAAQVQRLKDAGINPAGVNFDSGMPAANPSINEAASQMAQPADYGQMLALQNARQTNFNQAIGTMVEASEALSRVRKNETEGTTLKDANRRANELHAGNLQEQGLQIEGLKFNLYEMKPLEKIALSKSIDNLKLTGREMEEKIKNLQQERDNMIASMKLTVANTEYQKKVNDWYDENQRWGIRSIQSQMNVNTAHARNMWEHTKQLILSNNWAEQEWNWANEPQNRMQRHITFSNGLKLEFEGQRVERKNADWMNQHIYDVLDLDQDKKQWEIGLGIANTFLKSLTTWQEVRNGGKKWQTPRTGTPGYTISGSDGGFAPGIGSYSHTW